VLKGDLSSIESIALAKLAPPAMVPDGSGDANNGSSSSSPSSLAYQQPSVPAWMGISSVSTSSPSRVQRQPPAPHSSGNHVLLSQISEAPPDTSATRMSRKETRRHWCMKNMEEAVDPESPLVLKGTQKVSQALTFLEVDKVAWPYEECYVFSDNRKKWYKLWSKFGKWRGEQGVEVPEVKLERIMTMVHTVDEAIDLLNNPTCLWPYEDCFVFWIKRRKWYRLWSVSDSDAQALSSCATGLIDEG